MERILKDKNDQTQQSIIVGRQLLQYVQTFINFMPKASTEDTNQ